MTRKTGANVGGFDRLAKFRVGQRFALSVLVDGGRGVEKDAVFGFEFPINLCGRKSRRGHRRRMPDETPKDERKNEQNRQRDQFSFDQGPEGDAGELVGAESLRLVPVIIGGTGASQTSMPRAPEAMKPSSFT